MLKAFCAKSDKEIEIKPEKRSMSIMSKFGE